MFRQQATQCGSKARYEILLRIWQYFFFLREVVRKYSHTNSYLFAMTLISQDDHLTAEAWAICVKPWLWWEKDGHGGAMRKLKILQKWDASWKRIALSRNDGLGGGTTASSLQGVKILQRGTDCRTWVIDTSMVSHPFLLEIQSISTTCILRYRKLLFSVTNNIRETFSMWPVNNIHIKKNIMQV